MKLLNLLFITLIVQNVYSQTIDSSMVLIPSGEFTMGKNSPNQTDWQPEHNVHIDAFYMDKYEITNKQYYNFCIQTNYPLPEFWGMQQFKSGMEFPDYPVVGISFFDAQKYAAWAGKRLPTEAEWEYSARSGLLNNNYPWGNYADSTKVNFGKKYKGILKIGSFAPNAYGLYDISGNVWEWTSDNYSGDYYKISPTINPKGPENGRFKVIRGGSWHSGGMCVQTYYRNGLSPSWVDFAVGFRCAKDLK
jgi:formylglycine-generating enzyme